MRLLKRAYQILIQEGFVSLFIKIIEWRKERLFQDFLTKKEWFKAANYGEKLVRIFPRKIEYYQGVARCYKELKQDNLATSTLERGLKKIISMPEIMERLEKKLKPIFFLESNYVYLGGEQNLGCIDHKVKVNGNLERYFTKISTRSGFEKEKLFYLNMYGNFPELKKITPKLISFTEFVEENLILITTEKIDGEVTEINFQNIGEIIQAHKIIASVSFEKLKDYIPEPDFDGEFKLIYDAYPHHPISALHSFVSIHKRATNQQLFELVFKRMKDLGYSFDSYLLLKSLKKVIFDWSLFDRIKPDIHYSLLHGDFNNHNMLKDENTGKLYIIDWGNIFIGPRWIDIAGLFGQLKLPFHIVKDEYLFNQGVSGNFEPIEKIFFIYTLITTWFIVFTRSEFDNLHDLYIRPAVEMIESLALAMEGKRLGI